MCGWVCGLITHLITFIHDVRSQCGLWAAHHCFSCFSLTAVFVAFSLPAVFVAFSLPAVFVAFQCQLFSLPFLLLFASSILHGGVGNVFFMLCCFLTLFSVSVWNTLCRNCTLLCLPSFLITAQNVCVCVCVSALILHLFSLSLHNMMRLHFTKVYTMYTAAIALPDHYVITSLRYTTC